MGSHTILYNEVTLLELPLTCSISLYSGNNCGHFGTKFSPYPNSILGCTIINRDIFIFLYTSYIFISISIFLIAHCNFLYTSGEIEENLIILLDQLNAKK